MKHILFLITFVFFITNCTLNKVERYHGVNFLEKKQSKLEINKSNSNDITQLLGPASTKSTFDNDIWIYIERVNVSSNIVRFGEKILAKNNVLILEINNKGILSKKIFLNKDKMNEVKFSKDITTLSLKKKEFIYDFLYTLRKKINDPLNKKK